ncbi:hypothetical protein Glove_306g33 [Diversispora epigaea]|uniref:COX assembly mitochondrial protein n=1 Tax=Diversispora epigaea TaxID=1348612 RepID=A0A397HTV7_9GLOM|nr:hypothetical protein Glove_306g33 [Diversispora epigaea]
MSILTRVEEEKLYDKLKQNARKNCDDEVRDFVECTNGKVFSVMWTCKKQLKTMNLCLKKFTTQEELDKLRLEYIKEKKS